MADLPLASSPWRELELAAVRCTLAVAMLVVWPLALTPAEEPRPGPVTYAGDIPCADCRVQRVTLTLFPDFTFRLRRTFVGADEGKDAVFHDLGRWARAQDDGERLRLSGGRDAPQQFRFLGADRIRMLDKEGREIESNLGYELVRQAVVDRVAGPMRLRGMYSYMADAARLTECQTGTGLPCPP